MADEKVSLPWHHLKEGKKQQQQNFLSIAFFEKNKNLMAGVVEPSIIIDTTDYYLSISIFRMNKHTHFLGYDSHDLRRRLFMCLFFLLKKIECIFFLLRLIARGTSQTKPHDDIV